ncbi:MAG TPA: methylated-DNA--[protein]-cysteine S-methyltransferase [Nitrospirales bacterium]|nr:methylated-DNA--[protein]-cysteine S-methyltransferase [Nitrospirales bacterium]
MRKAAEVEATLKKSPMFFWISPSPVGRLLLVGNFEGLQILQFQDGAHPLDIQPTWTKSQEPFLGVLKQLREYFAGSRTRFQITLNLQGTPFQRHVWKALQRIPYGQTVSYGEIARQIESPNASRAVGAANGKNPVSIIVPCHRVIGANGQLVGYGGGLLIKAALLELEQLETEMRRS